MTILQIALQQIQMPTWWITENPRQKIAAALIENARIKKDRRKVLIFNLLKSTGTGMLARDICSETKIPRASVQGILDDLRQEGLVVADTTKVRCAVAHVWRIKK
jgi:predicted transcriptional regulator